MSQISLSNQFVLSQSDRPLRLPLVMVVLALMAFCGLYGLGIAFKSAPPIIVWLCLVGLCAIWCYQASRGMEIDHYDFATAVSSVLLFVFVLIISLVTCVVFIWFHEICSAFAALVTLLALIIRAVVAYQNNPERIRQM